MSAIVEETEEAVQKAVQNVLDAAVSGTELNINGVAYRVRYETREGRQIWGMETHSRIITIYNPNGSEDTKLKLRQVLLQYADFRPACEYCISNTPHSYETALL